MQAVGTTLEQTERGDKEARRMDRSCVGQQKAQRVKGQKVTPCKVDETVVILIPRVMFGVDRAYE